MPSGHKKEFSKKEILDIINMYSEKKDSLTKIGKKYNCCIHVIRKLLIKEDTYLESKYKNKNFSQEKIEKIINYYINEKKSINEIHNIVGCANSTINKILRKNNIKIIRSPNEKIFTNLDIFNIIKLYNEGQSCISIAKKYDCYCSTISKLLKKNNIKITTQNLKKKFSNKDKKRVFYLYTKENKSCREISELYYTNHHQIINILKEFKINLNNIKFNKRKSIGEVKIETYLKRNKILYFNEYLFENCKNINKLRFDFYLPDHNLCIEYDGKQHYTFIKYFHKKYINFIKQLKRDMIKEQFCIKNDIKLIRIPYWEKSNVDWFLHLEFQKLGIVKTIFP